MRPKHNGPEVPGGDRSALGPLQMRSVGDVDVIAVTTVLVLGVQRRTRVMLGVDLGHTAIISP